MYSTSTDAADDAAFRQFNRQLDACRQIPAAEHRRLLQAARAGDREARAALVEANLRLVVWVARRERRGLSFAEAVQEGAAALLEAIDDYDPARAKFSTYAAGRIRDRYRTLAQRTARRQKREGLAA